MLELAQLRQALGRRSPPTEISQRPFDHDDAHLRRLAHLQPDEQPNPMDLVEYALDLQYEEVQICCSGCCHFASAPGGTTFAEETPDTAASSNISIQH